MIKESDAVIADLSGAAPNVLYEAGFAHALDIETIHISLARPWASFPSMSATGTRSSMDSARRINSVSISSVACERFSARRIAR